MSTWIGWRNELLKAAGVPLTTAARDFIYQWNKHAQSDCHNNPLDISHTVRGATACQRLTPTRTAQNYTSHKQAADAFAAELHSGNFRHLAAAITATDPYKVADTIGVIRDIERWGSVKFAQYYGTKAPPPPGPGPGPPPKGGTLPKGHHGYHDLQVALARTLPTNLRRSKIIRQRVLRKMGAPSNLK